MKAAIVGKDGETFPTAGAPKKELAVKPSATVDAPQATVNDMVDPDDPDTSDSKPAAGAPPKTPAVPIAPPLSPVVPAAPKVPAPIVRPPESAAPATGVSRPPPPEL